MKCPACVATGLKSTIAMTSGAYRTALPTHQFYDEEGRYHYHDPNKTTTSMRCSNGHTIRVTETAGCTVDGCIEATQKIEVS